MTEQIDSGTKDCDPGTETRTKWTQAVQHHYEPNGDCELTTAIVFAIAEAEGVSPTEMRSPVLYDCIDAPALEDTFFGPSGGEGDRRGVGTIEFHYAGYLVRVRNDGWIEVLEPTAPDRR